MLITLLVVIVGLVSARKCPPRLPMSISGQVYYEGHVLDDGYLISVEVGEEDLGIIGEISGGYYSVDISPCIDEGIIKFYINGIEANETVDFQMAKDIQLDLSLNELPPSDNPCGNGIIESGEECDSENLGGTTCGDGWTGQVSCTDECKVDYSGCELIIDNGDGNHNGGGGGSGGGGGVGNPIILNGDDDTDEVNENLSEELLSLNQGFGDEDSGDEGKFQWWIISLGIVLLIGLGVFVRKIA